MRRRCWALMASPPTATSTTSSSSEMSRRQHSWLRLCHFSLALRLSWLQVAPFSSAPCFTSLLTSLPGTATTCTPDTTGTISASLFSVAFAGAVNGTYCRRDGHNKIPRQPGLKSLKLLTPTNTHKHVCASYTCAGNCNGQLRDWKFFCQRADSLANGL